MDNAGRETGISYPTGTNVSFSMDSAGRRTSMTDSTGTTGYTPDAAGRITQIAAPNGTVNYGYDNANRRTSMSISGSSGSWSYSYDAANRMTSTSNPYSETSSMGFDAANRMTSQTNGNSSLTSWVYDTANRVTDVWHKKSDTTTVLGHYAYSHDAVGNVTERDDNDTSITVFGYDASDQLTSEARSVVGAYSVSYTYDHNGNRKTKVLGGVTDTYSYGNHDQLNSVSFGGGGSKSYVYDNNGNCTSVTSGTNVTSLSYDYENRAVGITYPSSATNSFQYNGLDLRTQKVDSAGTFNYTTDGTSPASPVLKDGAATYTPGLSEHRGSTSKFYHSDALGSTRGVTDSTQAATDAVLYDAFGMTVSRTGTTPTPFGFVGKAQYQTDSDSGLQLLGHRYYDASVGRFISSDPAKAGSNWFAYCDNNPVIHSDPQGLDDKGGTDKAGRFANMSSVDIRIVFDLKEPICGPGQDGKPIFVRKEYYIDLPPGFTSSPKLDVDWVREPKQRNRWDHIWPYFGGSGIGDGDRNYPHLPGNGRGGRVIGIGIWPPGFGGGSDRPTEPPPVRMKPDVAMQRGLIKEL